MDKLVFSITVTETDEGFKVEAAGDRAKELLKCGCIPLAVSCCSTASVKMSTEGCETDEAG